jgi:hypothetical protein
MWNIFNIVWMNLCVVVFSHISITFTWSLITILALLICVSHNNDVGKVLLSNFITLMRIKNVIINTKNITCVYYMEDHWLQEFKSSMRYRPILGYYRPIPIYRQIGRYIGASLVMSIKVNSVECSLWTVVSLGSTFGIFVYIDSISNETGWF